MVSVVLSVTRQMWWIWPLAFDLNISRCYLLSTTLDHSPFDRKRNLCHLPPNTDTHISMKFLDHGHVSSQVSDCKQSGTDLPTNRPSFWGKTIYSLFFKRDTITELVSPMNGTVESLLISIAFSHFSTFQYAMVDYIRMQLVAST